MGKFEIGNNLSNGRPRGSGNKVSKEIREFSALLLQQELETLKEKLPTLNDSDYLKAISMLYKNVLPSQKYIETHEAEMPTSFEIEIIDSLSQVTNKEVEGAIDGYVLGQRNK
jgi:hypothetical protein